MKILILAAGNSSRFKSGTKFLFKFLETPIIKMIYDQCLKIAPTEIITKEEFKDQIKINCNKYIQDAENYGTAHAVISYLNQISKADLDNLEDLIIVPADMPLIDDSELAKIAETDADVVIGKMPYKEGRYGRIFENDCNQLLEIKEFSEYPEKVDFLNSGIMKLSKKALNLLPLIKLTNNELYLTDIVKLSVENSLKTVAVELNALKTYGFNSIEELNELIPVAFKLWRTKALRSGAIFYDINSTYLSHDTYFEEGSIIEPNCIFLSNVKVRSNAVIKANSYLSDCDVDCSVGPFGYVKSSIIGKQSTIGCFVEINRSCISENVKIKHLSYVGDSEIKENVNIGAGVVFCNYDGKKKHKTLIEKNVFVGSNSALIAPLTIEEGSFLAAGGNYNKDIKKWEIVIARSKQSVIGKAKNSQK